MIVSLIAAMSSNRVIGFHNRLPWKLPADTAYFKRVTAGKKFIMGRKSYESPDMFFSPEGNIIVTRQTDYKVDANSEIAMSLEEAFKKLANEPEVFVIGGAQLFEQALAVADFIYLTLIEHRFEGDAFFPPIPASDWQLIEEVPHPKDDENSYSFYFMKYARNENRRF